MAAPLTINKVETGSKVTYTVPPQTTADQTITGTSTIAVMKKTGSIDITHSLDPSLANKTWVQVCVALEAGNHIV